MIQEALFLTDDFDLTSFAQGPPSNSDGSIKDVTINADGTCGNGWICEHRWKQIHNMVEFRYTYQFQLSAQVFVQNIIL